MASTAASIGGSRHDGNKALIPTVVMTSVATVVVGLRCYTRCRISHCFGLDDYAILFALVGALICCY